LAINSNSAQEFNQKLIQYKKDHPDTFTRDLLDAQFKLGLPTNPENPTVEIFNKTKEISKKSSPVEEAEERNPIEVFKYKYVKQGDSYTELPNWNEDSCAIFSSNDDEGFRVHKTKEGEIYGYGDKFDRTFKTIDELVKFLNDNGYNYVGID
jgi:hypothetical protein